MSGEACPMGGKDQKLVSTLKPATRPRITDPASLVPGQRIVFQNKVYEFVRRESEAERGVSILTRRYVFMNIMDDDGCERVLEESEVRAASLLVKEERDE